MLLRGGLLLWVAAACWAPAAAVPASSRTLIDPAPPRPHPQGCSEREERCLSDGILPFAVDGRCYEPLSRGPCAEEGFWFVLERASNASTSSSSSTSSSKILSGTCVRRPCAIEEIPYQGRCLTTAVARRELCARAKIHLDPEGNPRCGQAPSWRILLARYVSCTQVPTPSTDMPNISATAIVVGGPRCSSTDEGDCTREVVTPTSGSIELHPED